MGILIVIPKYTLSKEANYDYPFPLGLAYISSSLKKEGYQVDCFNLNHYNGNISELMIGRLNKKKYDTVCVGGNALAFHSIKKIIGATRGHLSMPVVILGGPIITSEPNLIFNLLNPDIAVVGEGERTIIELLKCLEKKENLMKINGIIYRNSENKIIITKRREPIKDIDSIPSPDFEGVEFEKQLDHMFCNYHWVSQIFDYPRVYPLLASRGCPFNCSFCWHDMKYRERSIKNIMQEIKLMVKCYKINYIQIYDDCFSANKERLYKFCREIKKLSNELSWKLKWGCQLLVTNVDKNILRTMKNAGCDNISYGFESFSPVVLRSMGKPITPQEIDKVLKETLKNNISIQGNFIFGDIAETKETARETLEYWKSCQEAQQISLGFVQPYPGSALYSYCLKKGIIKDKRDYIKNQMGPDTRLNMTKEMSDEEITELNKEILGAFRKHFNFITPSSLKKMKKNLYEFDFKCPFCKQVIHYKNCFIKNKLTYGFHIICRNCHMRSVLVGPIKKFAYKYYPKTRKIRNICVALNKKLRQKKV